jgi:predicted neuraminidase
MDYEVNFDKTQIILNPGPEYGDNVRMFQGIPSIARAPGGRLWAAWYGGGITEDRENYVMLSTSDDAGESWSKLKLVVDPDGPGPMRAYDPFVWLDPDERLWLCWNQNLDNHNQVFTEEQERNWWLWGITTDDPPAETPSWSEPRRLCEAFVLNKPTVLSTGEWLLCSSDHGWDWSARVFRSTDRGETWQHLGRAHVPNKADRSYDEHMVVERRDGSLWMLVRTKYGIGESFSTDRGRCWRYVTPSGIAHACSRFFIRRLRSGNLLLVKHGGRIEQWPVSRCMLTAFLSDDDGRTWRGGLMLDAREGASYPDGDEGPDGTLSIIYDYRRSKAKEILMARITERDILEGKLVSGDSRLQICVNKARGINPRE